MSKSMSAVRRVPGSNAATAIQISPAPSRILAARSHVPSFTVNMMSSSIGVTASVDGLPAYLADTLRLRHSSVSRVSHHTLSEKSREARTAIAVCARADLKATQVGPPSLSEELLRRGRPDVCTL